eukprot:1040380-Pyramimonas_sp.AAC.1
MPDLRPSAKRPRNSGASTAPARGKIPLATAKTSATSNLPSRSAVTIIRLHLRPCEAGRATVRPAAPQNAPLVSCWTPPPRHAFGI